jgi:hypothetical protein
VSDDPVAHGGDGNRNDELMVSLGKHAGRSAKCSRSRTRPGPELACATQTFSTKAPSVRLNSLQSYILVKHGDWTIEAVRGAVVVAQGCR